MRLSSASSVSDFKILFDTGSILLHKLQAISVSLSVGTYLSTHVSTESISNLEDGNRILADLKFLAFACILHRRYFPVPLAWSLNSPGRGGGGALPYERMRDAYFRVSFFNINS